MRKLVKIRIKYNSTITIGHVKKLEVTPGETLVVETEHGLEFAKALSAPETPPDQNDVKKALKINRIASEQDLESEAELLQENKKAYDICHEKIKKHKLPMKLVAAHHFLEGSKILFYFTSEGRVDFRGLVKDLAAIFKTRIELRQIGVRDEAQMEGGIGVCGLTLCCHACKNMTQPVSIKMAKEQNLALNSSKISGACGRLLCCLGYEYDTYKDLNKKFPRIGSKIWIGDDKAIVKDINIQNGMVKLMKEDHSYLEVPHDKIKTNKITGKRIIELEK